MPAAHRRLLLLLALGSVLLTALAANHGFFWDAVLQASRYAQWYYHTNFSRVLVPEAYDAGHPPLFGMALAAVWRLGGTSLAVSHWAMLPLVLGVLWQLYRLARHWLPVAWVGPGLLLLWLDPTWLAQSTLVSSDVALTFCYLLSLNGLLVRRPWQVVAGSVPLVLLSSRGTLLLLALGMTELLLHAPAWGRALRLYRLRTLLVLWRRMWPLLPAAAAAAGWLGLHYALTGWVGYHANSPWAANTASVGFSGILRNGVLIIWRLLDHGRIGLWLTGAVLLAWQWRRGVHPDAATWRLVALWLPPMLVISGTMLWYANPIGHRYYLASYFPLTLLVVHLLSRWQPVPSAAARAVVAALALLLLSGHSWVYPDRIANGWDATLAHWPYYGLRQRMLQWLDAQAIALDSVGSAFPNRYSLHDTDLSGEHRRFAPLDLSRNCYVLQSNVMNLDDATLDTLQQRWHLRREEQAGQVYLRLYEKKADGK